MVRVTILFLAYFIFSNVHAGSDSVGTGLVSVKSEYDVESTADRLEAVLLEKGMTVFARINHAEAAWKIKKKLRPTQLVIFGNPKIGTLLMQCQQTAAIDLPQKALVWEDAQGDVWLSYNDPSYIALRHGIEKCDGVIEKIRQALANFSGIATTR